MGYSTDWLAIPLWFWMGLLMQTTQFVYDGKESSNSLLLSKARAFVRQSEKCVWREWEESDDASDDEEGWIKVPADIFFEAMWSEKPADLSDKQYSQEALRMGLRCYCAVYTELFQL